MSPIRRILIVAGILIAVVSWGITIHRSYSKLTYPRGFLSPFRTSDGILSPALNISGPSEKLLTALQMQSQGDFLFVLSPKDDEATLIAFHVAYLGAPHQFVPIDCAGGIANFIRREKFKIAAVVVHRAAAPPGSRVTAVGPNLLVAAPPANFDVGSLCR